MIERETLPASWYHDESVWQRERRAIFRRHWALVARADQLAREGDCVAGEVAGWPVLVVRGRDGVLRGFHNVCRHRASPLVEDGACRAGRLLVCPYHGWSYELDGRLARAPGFDDAGDGFERETHGLFPARVAAWNGLVFVALDEEAPALEDWLGEVVDIAREFRPIPEMAFVRELAREGNANWKAYSDNSAEGYHLPSVHKGLSAVIAPGGMRIEPRERGAFVGFRIGYGAFGGKERSEGCWVYKFPCLLLHFSEFGFNCERVIPLGARRVRIRRWFWFPPSADERERRRNEELVAASDQVMGEDIGVCEAVQRNLEAGRYERGVLSPAREPGTIFFQRLVRESLAAMP